MTKSVTATILLLVACNQAAARSGDSELDAADDSEGKPSCAGSPHGDVPLGKKVYSSNYSARYEHDSKGGGLITVSGGDLPPSGKGVEIPDRTGPLKGMCLLERNRQVYVVVMQHYRQPPDEPGYVSAWAAATAKPAGPRHKIAKWHHDLRLVGEHLVIGTAAASERIELTRLITQ